MTKKILYILIAIIMYGSVPSLAHAMGESASGFGIETQQIRIAVSSQGSISIYGAKGQMAYIYNVLGVKIASYEIDNNEKRIDLSLASGYYIVKVGNTARKIFIKR